MQEPPKPPSHRPLRREFARNAGIQYKNKLEAWERECTQYEEKSKAWERQQRNERYTADPAAYVSEVLGREYRRFKEHSTDLRYRRRYYRLAENFIQGPYLRALKECYKRGDPEATCKFIDHIRHTILDRIPDSTFRRELLDDVDSWALVGFQGRRI